jgi:hypothetical protein
VPGSEGLGGYVREWGEVSEGEGRRGRNDSNIVCTYEYNKKEKRIIGSWKLIKMKTQPTRTCGTQQWQS